MPVSYTHRDVYKRQGVNMFIRLAIRAPFLTVGSIVMAFTINWKIALVFLLSTPLIVDVYKRQLIALADLFVVDDQHRGHQEQAPQEDAKEQEAAVHGVPLGI